MFFKFATMSANTYWPMYVRCFRFCQIQISVHYLRDWFLFNLGGRPFNGPSNGVTVKITYGVDVLLHGHGLHPTLFYWAS